jgi:hypothetical protein
VPGSTVGVGLRIHGPCQGLVHGPTVLGRRSRIDGRADQGMAEPHLRPDVDELLGVGGRSRLSSDPERLRGTPEQCDIPGRICSGDQKQSLCGLRQRFETPQKVFLELTGKVPRIRDWEAAREFRGGHTRRQF